MAICEWCELEMTDERVTSCPANHFVEFPGGEGLPAIWYIDTGRRRCHDCNIAPGGYHHPGCDMERCPRCQGQLISCGCLDEEDED